MKCKPICSVRCTIHIWGLMLPPCFIQLPMVTQPKDFRHIKKVATESGVGVTTFRALEKGDTVGSNTNEFQKYCGKKLCIPIKKYDGTESYDPQVDLKNDEFLSSLGKEKKKFDVKMKKDWEKKVVNRPRMDQAWYMIVQDGGKEKVGLYQDYAVFESIHNADYIVKSIHNADYIAKMSLKGVRFTDLEAAKTYIQMARDEEGVHWGWPQEIPVLWKTVVCTVEDVGHELEDFCRSLGQTWTAL